jgi:AmmeMemoRadiSam system protein A
VTLKKNGALRGCIGRIQADVALPLLVSAMALEAALQDPRFPPVTAAELDSLQIEVSVLSEPRRVNGPAAIVIGRDGVVLRRGSASAVFLPQVAVEEDWNLEEMLAHLSVKAGLPADGWTRGAQFWTFQTDTFREGRRR